MKWHFPNKSRVYQCPKDPNHPMQIGRWYREMHGLILTNTSIFALNWCTLAWKIDNMHWQCRSPSETRIVPICTWFGPMTSFKQLRCTHFKLQALPINKFPYDRVSLPTRDTAWASLFHLHQTVSKPPQSLVPEPRTNDASKLKLQITFHANNGNLTQPPPNTK